jgi:ubiquinone/menaquinone biosynthesis C-methylase UbiE
VEEKDNIGMYRFHMYDGASREQNEKPDQFMLDALGNAKIIAELGCGSGFYCKYLQNYAEKLYCVDSNKEAIKELKKRIDNDNTIVLNEDASHTSIPSNTVDAVLFANSFHDMREREKVYEEALRILKHAGSVIIVDWEKKETSFGPPMSIRMNKEDYIGFFKDFKLEKEFIPGINHYGLVFKRK